MTWRVAILAFTIMLAGATAPVIRDAVGGRDGYRVMGVAMALVIVVGVLSAYRGTRHAPIGAVEPGPGTLRDQLRIVAGARDFRLLLTTFVVQALATGCMLAGVDYLATDVLDRKGATTVLFVCFVGPALLLTPAWAALGARIGKKRGYLRLVRRPRRRCACWPCWPGRRRSAVVFAARRAGRRRVRRLPGLPAGDAARRRGGRRAADRQQPGRRLHRRLDRRRDARARAGSRALRARARPRRLPLEHRRRRGPARLRADRDHARLLAAAGRPDRSSACCGWRATPSAPTRSTRAPPESQHERRPRAAARRCRPPTCRCTAAGPWPTSTTRASRTSTGSAARRSRRTPAPTASTRRRSRACSGWRTTWSASRSACSTDPTPRSAP